MSTPTEPVTVRRLIQKLRELPPDLEIMLVVNDRAGRPSATVVANGGVSAWVELRDTAEGADIWEVIE